MTEQMEGWEIVSRRLSELGWAWECVGHSDDSGRLTVVVHAQRADGRRFMTRSGELMTAFLALENALAASCPLTRVSSASSESGT
jgi:hypothetical protein